MTRLLRLPALTPSLVAWAQPALAEPAVDSDTALEQAWDAARRGATWRSPTAREREVVEDAMADLARAAATCDDAALTPIREALAAVDMALATWSGPTGDRALMVLEGVERRGAGMFVVRCGEALPVVWQAPHAIHDLHTGALTRLFFVESGARAAMWNTVHRYRALEGEREDDPVHPADVTREYGSLFHAATVGLATAAPDLKFVQVHGFARDEFPWDAVVSSGGEAPPPLSVAGPLEAALGAVAVYGRDVDELGATVNVQGRMLAAWSEPRFLHVEIDPDGRKDLLASAERRAALYAALAAGGWSGG